MISVVKCVNLLIICAVIVVLTTVSAIGQDAVGDKTDAGSAHDSLHTVSLKDGSTLRGRITAEDENEITVVTLSGIKITVPKTEVVSMSSIRGRVEEGTFKRFDPNYSRLLFAPTGRPLGKEDGYFSDYYVFFPGVTYGFTNTFSLMAGMSVVPGMELDEQIKYLAPKIGLYNTEKLAVSGGILYVSLDGKNSAGITFVTGTYGPRNKCMTVGIGYGYFDSKDEQLEFTHRPIFTLGGNIRLTNNIALVSENWFLPFENFTLKEQPICLALRFFGDRIAVDVGMIIVGEVVKEGLPIPWLSFVYNFGD